MSSLKPAVFLDRDGVINRDTGYTHKLDELEILAGVADGCRQLIAAGLELVIVTNQSGIARGLYNEQDYQRFSDELLNQLSSQKVHFLAVYFCPHHKEGEMLPYRQVCDCRKPGPGMLFRAANEHPIDLSRSYIVGDRASDLEAGQNAGLKANVLIETGKAITPEGQNKADYVAANFITATEWILTDFNSH
ncbi:D,D-heptose 1,7-bisphosphate phosphatase [Neiella marina]|uniref:D,D-heptose 1,7-bisphosphate phosphatase n=1 Tax=Neiella marina TaxID=508461 RepID=A0A8J2XQ87_9GAMM|nr:D-glycero-beta-D-manno-heptose 1,7-bisphosphate 7-phosphatase [Neiella marina]GGA91188.1 D,D-heptose 1,7-bisphosphate phosphatase [Neiella marina]